MTEPFYSFSTFLKKKYPRHKVQKIPINAHFPCPNKDGTISSRGCIFCDRYGSGPVKSFTLPVTEQIENYMVRYPGRKYLAYFQAHTNTNAPLETLRQVYEVIFDYPDIVGLFVGTRPDTVSEEVFGLFSQLRERTYLCVELGLQSIHAESLLYLNRNHSYCDFLATHDRLKKGHIDTVVHLIIGIPRETREDMLATVREMNRVQPSGVKFHLFHVLRDTALEVLYRQGGVPLLEKEAYIELIIFLLEQLNPTIVIHRLTGERDRTLFIAPEWALNKAEIIHAIRSRMIERNSRQGQKIAG